MTSVFRLLSFMFSVFPFVFSVLCFEDVLRTVIFSLGGAIKRSTANVLMPRWRKKECRETNTRIRIMLHFMQLAHPRHMDIYIQNSEHKSLNTETISFEHRTQNICI